MKKSIVCLVFVIAGFLFLSTDGHAFSLQVRGAGMQGIGGDGSASGSLIGLDVFAYEGENIDVFLGYEQGSFSGEKELSWNDSSAKSKYSFSSKMTGYLFGIRYRPTVKWGWKPYLSLGVINQNVDSQEFTSKDPDFIIISAPKPASSIGERAGAGVDIGISDRVTLELGAVAVFPMFSTKMKYQRKSNIGSNVYEIQQDTGGIGINLGLRYSF